MPKVFRPSHRESSILSKIESTKEHARKHAISGAKEKVDTLASSIAMKLVEFNLVETTNKNSLEDQLKDCIKTLVRSDDFDIDYQIAPFRHITGHPHVVSLYLTAFIIEKLINHRDIIDIYGSDEEIYSCIHKQVSKILK